MDDLVTSLFGFFVLLTLCRASSRCDLAFLNQRFHIRLRRPWLDRLLLHHPAQSPREWVRRRREEARSLMGIDGILAYLLLVPPALWFQFARGCFSLLRVGTLPGWYEGLFWGFVVFATADFQLGSFLLWRKEGRKRREEGDG